MKIRLLLIILMSSLSQIFAQTSTDEQKNIEQKLMRNWVKYRIEMKDGSHVLDENIAKNAASMLIFKKGNGIIINGKNAQQVQYAILNSFLVLGGTTSYVIEKLNENELIFHENSKKNSDNEIIRYHYVSTTESSWQYFYRQFIKPNISVKADGDTAYKFNEYIFPKFKPVLNNSIEAFSDFYDVYEASYNFIEDNFKFPEKKKGNFNVTFAVSKLGILKDVVVRESSDSTYNAALSQAVYQTRKHWLPAEFGEKNVETLFNYAFIFNGEDISTDFDSELYQIFKNKADKQFEKNEYVKAIKLYTKCILMQQEDFDLEPYYKRADSYFALKVNKNACLDWSYLSKKGQKKADKLFFDNCMK